MKFSGRLTKRMSDLSNQNGYFTGQLLVAMPNLRDPRFTRSVIYMCVHNEEGAMGLVLNRLIGAISFSGFAAGA